jgi:ABC-type multidrug transport system fused ATPase/permease subunit
MRSFFLWEIIQGLRKLLSPRDKWCLAGLIVLLCISALMEIAGIGLLLPLVAVFTKPELLEQNLMLRFFRQLFSWADEKVFILICCGCIVLVYIIKNLWLFFTIHLYTSFTYRHLGEIGTRLYWRFLSGKYRIFQEHGKVELQTLINKVDQLGFMVLLPCMVLAVDVLTIVFISGMLLWAIPKVVCGCILILGTGCLAIYLVLKKLSSDLGEKLSAVFNRLNKISLYSLEDVKTVKILGLENFFTDSFRDVRKQRCHLESRHYVLGQIPRLVLEMLAVVAALTMFAVMLWRGEAIGTVILSFSLLIGAMARLLPAISRINYSLSSIRIGTPIFREITGAVEFEQEKLGDVNETLSFKEEIRVENLTFSYPGSGRKVIDGLSFTLKRNGSLAVTGPTGGGKSTFIDLLLGLQDPQKGSISVDGKDISLSIAAWRKLIGFVPQHIYLADDSIAANVALGHTGNTMDRNRVRDVLRIAQLDSFVESLPEGIDTCIGDNGIRLSGGQRQRLGIARALYRDPEIIIFDEATSALDTETEKELISALDALYGQKTLIMVAHRLSTVEKCGQRIEIRPAADQ